MVVTFMSVVVMARMLVVVRVRHLWSQRISSFFQKSLPKSSSLTLCRVRERSSRVPERGQDARGAEVSIVDSKS